ncbi:cupin domain-containing protein [bacterium]
MKEVLKPWGKELWFVHNENYLGKLIYIDKGTRLSKQYHNKKQETFFSIQGKFILELNGEEIVVNERTPVTIKAGDIHRVSAPFENVQIIEISTPESDDIVRIEDDFDRLK